MFDMHASSGLRANPSRLHLKWLMRCDHTRPCIAAITVATTSTVLTTRASALRAHLVGVCGERACTAGLPLRPDGLHAWSIIGWLSRPNSAARLRSCPAPMERRSDVTQKFESGTRARSIFCPYCFATLRCPLRRHVSSSGPAQVGRAERRVRRWQGPRRTGGQARALCARACVHASDA